MRTAIFGATGHLGTLVIDSLLERGSNPDDILALGRNQEKLAALAIRGVRTAQVDLDTETNLSEVLAGVQKVLLISTSDPGKRVPQHQAVVDAASAANVDHIVYTSLLQAPTSPLVLAPDHRATEELITASGIAATFLRNGWYTENHAQEFDLARQTGLIANSVGDGRLATAPRSDYAEAAAVVLTNPGHEGAIYELSGDATWDYTEFAQRTQDALGTPVRYQEVSPEEEREQLLAAGLDEGTAGFVGTLNASTRDNALAFSNGDLARLLGRPTEPLAQTLSTWV